MKSGIYQILNLVNGKKYIGSAVDITARWGLHRRQLNNNIHHSEKLQRAWNKYGKENFKFEILINCEKEELLDYEQLHFDELNPEYNICKVAGSMFGFKFDEISKLKMSESAKVRPCTFKDRKHTEVSRAKMSESAKANPQLYWQDKNLSDEHKSKIAIAHIGLKQSQETIDKRIKTRLDKRLAMFSSETDIVW